MAICETLKYHKIMCETDVADEIHLIRIVTAQEIKTEIIRYQYFLIGKKNIG